MTYHSGIVTVSILLLTGVLTCPLQADWDLGDDHKMHFPQLPDVDGWDVEFVSNTNKIGDDWVCSQSGPVTDIHFWMSWQNDNEPFGWPGLIDSIGVEIYDNVEPDTLLPFSRPGNLLWDRVFDTTQPNVTRRPAAQGPQGWYSPQLGMQEDIAWNRPDHDFYEQVNIFNIDNPFIQQEGEVYWLVLWVDWVGTQNPAGWKTADLDRYPDQFAGQHFMDDAVWYDWTEQDPLLRWHEIIDPQTMQSLDLAFVITPEPASAILLASGGMLLLVRRQR